MRLCLLALALAAAPLVRAQPAPSTTDVPSTTDGPVYDVGGFGTVALTTGGFSVGGGTRRVLDAYLRLVLDASLGTVADERETRFTGPDGAAIPSKYEFLLLLPTRVGIERRLFVGQIEENVRPFVRLGVGPTVGIARPYFADCNGNQRYDRRADCNADGAIAPGEGEAVLGFSRSLERGRALLGTGATLAAGAHLGRSRRGLQTVTVAYRLEYLPSGVQLLEPGIRARQYWFVTPDVSLSLRLF